MGCSRAPRWMWYGGRKCTFMVMGPEALRSCYCHISRPVLSGAMADRTWLVAMSVFHAKFKLALFCLEADVKGGLLEAGRGLRSLGESRDCRLHAPVPSPPLLPSSEPLRLRKGLRDLTGCRGFEG